jgi:hypothetical protein
MLINEILDSKVKSRITKDSKEEYEAKAFIGERWIIFNAYQDDPADKEWNVQFFEKDKEGDLTTAKTDSGNELQVFSFVKECFLDLVQKYKPNMCVFSGDHDGKNQIKNSRAQLYIKMFKKFKIAGYSLESEEFDGTYQFYFQKDGYDGKEKYADK